MSGPQHHRLIMSRGKVVSRHPKAQPREPVLFKRTDFAIAFDNALNGAFGLKRVFYLGRYL